MKLDDIKKKGKGQEVYKPPPPLQHTQVIDGVKELFADQMLEAEIKYKTWLGQEGAKELKKVMAALTKRYADVVRVHDSGLEAATLSSLRAVKYRAARLAEIAVADSAVHIELKFHTQKQIDLTWMNTVAAVGNRLLELVERVQNIESKNAEVWMRRIEVLERIVSLLLTEDEKKRDEAMYLIREVLGINPKKFEEEDGDGGTEER